MAVNNHGVLDLNDVGSYVPSYHPSTLFSSSSGIGSSITSSSVNNYYNKDRYKSGNSVVSGETEDAIDKSKLRQSNVPDYQYTATKTSPIEEFSKLPGSQTSTNEMNMRFADLTHMHLKRSIDQHNSQNEHVNRYYKPSSSSSSTYTYSSNGSMSPRIESLSVMSVNGGNSRDCGNTDLTSNSKYQSIIAVKDAILEEKESQIVKLRYQLNALESGNSSARSYESNPIKSLSGLTISSARSESDSGDYESATMRLRLAETFAQQEKNVNDLQNLLGKTECQLAESKMNHNREKKSYEEKIKELEFCLRAKEKTLEKSSKKQKELLARIEKYKRRVESLERYLSEVPTSDESKEIKRNLDTLTRDKSLLIEELEDLKEKLFLSQEEVKLKEQRLHHEASNNIELENKIKDLLIEIDSYKNIEKDLGLTERKQYENVLLELDELKKERQESAKLLTAADLKIKNLTVQYMSEINTLKDKCEQQENAVQTLKQDLSTKQQNSLKIQTALTQVNSQNQQLMEEKLTLMEQLRNRESERSSNRHVARLNVRLHREVQTAVVDLQTVSNLLIQSAKGDDPNLSALLGVRPSSVGLLEEEMEGRSTTGTSDSSDADSDLSLDGIKQKLNQVRRLRKDLDELRSNISNKYAENIGQNCATQ